MKERPILFSGEMVRAILDGRKTVTRRVVTERSPWPGGPSWQISELGDGRTWPHEYVSDARTKLAPMACPYGGPHDDLWVRETWQAWRPVSTIEDAWEPITKEVRGALTLNEWFAENGTDDTHKVEYRAGGESIGPWTPAIFMPRWACRIELRITSVRVERLHDITEQDAIREGVTWARGAVGQMIPGPPLTPREAFERLWKDINGAESWDANPWVWRVAFRRLET